MHHIEEVQEQRLQLRLPDQHRHTAVPRWLTAQKPCHLQFCAAAHDRPQADINTRTCCGRQQSCSSSVCLELLNPIGRNMHPHLCSQNFGRLVFHVRHDRIKPSRLKRFAQGWQARSLNLQGVWFCLRCRHQSQPMHNLFFGSASK